MTIYINNNFDSNEPIALEVPEKFKAIISEADFEGEDFYEDLADELRELVESQIENPIEMYDDFDCAVCWSCPILCW